MKAKMIGKFKASQEESTVAEREKEMSNCEKTADEMFRELGYEKEMETSVEMLYKNKRHSSIIIRKDLRTVSAFFDRFQCCLCYEEILACAQLIREMGCAD